MAKIYIAGFFDTRERLLPIRDKIREMGHEVLSSWLDEKSNPTGELTPELAGSYAIRDLMEIRQSNLIIVDTLDVTSRGGREVEYGYSLNNVFRMDSWVVGPKRNIFHYLANKHFNTWEEALDALHQ